MQNTILEPARDIPERNAYDALVYGATPGGIACAVRAAREGLTVLLVHRSAHVGGFITSGAGGWEAPYDGPRSPLYAEMLHGAQKYYRDTYGADSPQYRASLPNPETRRHIDRPKIEPCVAEKLFLQMLQAEQKLTLLTGYEICAAKVVGRLVRYADFRALRDGTMLRVKARCWADGTYEGDLLAAVGVTTRIGREACDEYDEPHAGVIYTARRARMPGQRGFPLDADQNRLNIRYNPHSSGAIVPGPHSGEGDSAVMAYNFRLILTDDPENRLPLPPPTQPEPPPNWTGKLKRSIVPDLPNRKIAWNGGGRLVGPQHRYPAGEWRTRDAISREYLEAALNELWWAQHHPAADPEERAFWSRFGLAADEFPDNRHLPYEVYVREARRLVGRYVFTEHDNKRVPGKGRTPVHHDSVAITDWPLDSVACVPRSVPGASLDGIFFLAEESRPAQVPYRCLLPREVDNLLAPVPLSASHVGWGALRLEPVWMQTGEAAGFAAALALRTSATPGTLDANRLVRVLAENRSMISFFNDVDPTGTPPWIPAVLFGGTRGYFDAYDARPADPLDAATAASWAHGGCALAGCATRADALQRIYEASGKQVAQKEPGCGPRPNGHDRCRQDVSNGQGRTDRNKQGNRENEHIQQR